MTDTATVTDKAIAPARLASLRANAFAALLMLIVEYGLGISVNLYVTLPATDRGKGLLPGFAAALAHGPAVLALHAVVGTLLLAAGIAAFVRALLARDAVLTSVSAVALAAVGVAWLSGSRAVGHLTSGTSLTMALAAGVAMMAYAVIVFVIPLRRGAATQTSSGQSPPGD